jgi:hypothetical protein
LRDGVGVVLAAIDLLKLVEVSPSIPEIGIEGDGAVEPSACKP